MPKNEFSPDDPLDLVGCEFEGTATDTENMARCFVEEYFWMGSTPQEILELFKNPFYCSPHQVYQRYGDDWVKGLINDVAVSLQRRHEQQSGN